MQVEDYLQAQQRELEAGHEDLAGATAAGQGPYQPVGGSSQKAIEELMAAATCKGKVQVQFHITLNASVLVPAGYV